MSLPALYPPGSTHPADPLFDQIAERLSEIHRSTFKDVAVRTGSSAETVRRYHQGQDPSSRFLARFAWAYGVDTEKLIFGPNPRENAKAALRLVDASAQMLIDELAKRVLAGEISFVSASDYSGSSTRDGSRSGSGYDKSSPFATTTGRAGVDPSISQSDAIRRQSLDAS